MILRTVTVLGLAYLVSTASLAQEAQGPGDPITEHPSRSARVPKAARISLDDHVSTARFIAKDANAKLGHGPITVKTSSGANLPPDIAPLFEAAVIQHLVAAGYNTAQPDGPDSQTADLIITRTILVPEAEKQEAIRGSGTMGVSNRGAMMGLALNIDLGKPQKAVLETQIRLRIRDNASQIILWEGRASMDTREGDRRWTNDAIAERLAAALLDGLGQPGQAQVVTVDKR